MSNDLRSYESILDLLPSEQSPTPIVRLGRITGFEHAKVYAKLEWYNPFGAVKDRVAASLVRDAEARGLRLETLVEPTSGNTGIGLAMISNVRGYEFAATLSKAIPEEKRAALRLFGTDLYELDDDLCPMPGAPEGAMAKAEELAAQPGWTELNQYQNAANPEAHFATTGPEIWRQTSGQVTHFVAAMGTCGTITGTGRFLKAQNPDVQVIGVHPTDGHDIPGVRSRRALALTAFFKPEEYDQILEVSDEDAYLTCSRLHTEESIIAGPSSGLALAGALRAIPDEPGVIAIVIFPDNAFKYVSAFRRHLPDLFPPEDGLALAPVDPYVQHLKAAFAIADDGPDIITVSEANHLLESGVPLIDVRNPDEYVKLRIAGTPNIPLPELSAGRTDGLPEDKSATVALICAGGVRSVYALLELKAHGYTSVKSVQGGMAAWTAARLPTEEPA
ncbi:MAG: pyridoxal-phosphate dependent enzyme [Propionibacteriaceae bacterium]|jgi:cysteine synthase/rhodanese-related sulfurtransferase|nr:pyridoxal-phosphate dependent enzyme [Propionibacteriaceae bacterium]